MLLTYRINLKRQFLRNRNTSKWFCFRRKIHKYIRVARKIAQYSVSHKKDKLTSKTVKFLGSIPSCIACQTIMKYKNNKSCKKVSSVNLIVPACSTVKYPSIIYDEEKEVLLIKPLKLTLNWYCPVNFFKINQIELNGDYCYITVTVNDANKKELKEMIGVDLNIRHNLASIGNPKTKKVEYLGKGFIYKRVKYNEIRKRLQRQKRLNRVKTMGNKEQRVMNDLNHKISYEILEMAEKQGANVAIENLKGIRNAKVSKSFKKFLNSWQFYKLRLFLEYKSEAFYGCEIRAVNPKYTSQDCSSCGSRTKCKGKRYKCKNCGLEIHRDENASYNIANRGLNQS